MSTTTLTIDKTAAYIKTARHYFVNMFERHDPNQFCCHSYGILDKAIISLDSRFSVEVSFLEVYRGLIDTPRSQWRFERTIFCIENKMNRDTGFNRKNEYFVLPTEAMVTMSSNKKCEAIMSFLFDNNTTEFPEKEVHDDIKACTSKKPSIKFRQKEEDPKGSYIVSLRISTTKPSIPWGIKEALERMNANFQQTYKCMMEVRSMHQTRIGNDEDMDAPEAEATESHTNNEPSTKTTKPKAASPKKSSPKSIDSTNSDKKCSYCARKTTPMWRRGPAGPGTLCNACGVKWRHGKILCDDNATETAVSPSTATTENVDPLNYTKSTGTRAKRKYTKSTETSQPAKKQQKRTAKKNTVIDFTQDEGPSGSPYSLVLNTLIEDETNHALGVEAVEAATLLTLLKRS